MTARDLYSDILRELDRYQAPSFERHEYNYFFPKAVDKVLLDAYRLYKETSQSSEVLDFYSRTIAKDLNPGKADRTESVALALEDRYTLCVDAKFQLTKDLCPLKEGLSVHFHLEEIEAIRIKDVMRNSYLKPNLVENRAYWISENRSLKILHTSLMTEIDAWQIKKVNYITVKDPDVSAFLLPANYASASLPSISIPLKLLRLFVNATVAMFLENTMNPRISTHTTINQ